MGRSSSSGRTRRLRARPGSILTPTTSARRVGRARMAALRCSRRPRTQACARRVRAFVLLVRFFTRPRLFLHMSRSGSRENSDHWGLTKYLCFFTPLDSL